MFVFTGEYLKECCYLNSEFLTNASVNIVLI